LDRYREIIVASGWCLETYRRNPVFQNAHQYHDVIFTLGKALVTEVRDGRLYQCIEFAADANPLAKVAYGLYHGGFLNAVSVGFIPLRWVEGDSEAGFGRKYLEQELLEVSAVAIPANPNALQLALRAGAIESSVLRDLAGLLAQLLSSPPTNPPIHQLVPPKRGDGGSTNPLSSSSPAAASPTDTRALGPGSNEAQWLQLARDLAAILRRA
jgi:HK97 family phage prohead protease